MCCILNCNTVNTSSWHFITFKRRQLFNSWVLHNPASTRGHFLFLWRKWFYSYFLNVQHTKQHYHADRRRVWGFPGPRTGAAAQHPISDWLVCTGGSLLQSAEQARVTTQIKSHPLDALMSPNITFVDKQKNLSDEERCKVPAVQVKQDLQWCGGQLRCFKKSQHRQMCN